MRFIDESAAKTNLTRLRGRAPKGERLVCHAPHGRWRTTTMISSVRLDGSSACMAIERDTDAEVFQAYVRDVLCPTLGPGDIVVLDNLGAHNNDRTLALMAQAGAKVCFLPAYSPDLDPIETMWSKVKQFLRGSEARTAEELRAAIAAALRAVTPRMPSAGSPLVATSLLEMLYCYALCGGRVMVQSLSPAAL